MAIITNVKIEGGAELRRRLNKMNPEVNFRIMRDGIAEIAVLIAKNARGQQLLKGRGEVQPHQLTNRSFDLRDSIGPDLRALPKFAEVGTDIEYAAIHEFGLKGYPERPFMEPAFEVVEPRIPEIIVKHWRRQGGI
jgi:phage gpG-like protein